MTALSLSAEIATYLQSQSLPTSLNFSGAGTVNCFVGVMQSEPDLAVSVMDHGGMAPVMVLTGSSGPESPIDQATFQLRVRAGMTGATTGYALAGGIYKALQGITETRINGGSNGWFHLITALQPVTYLGQDENQRHRWAQNFHVVWDNPVRM